MTYDELKKYWEQQESAPGIAALEKTAYCLRFSQYGSTGSCGSGVQTTEAFNDSRNALAWLRFCVMPEILDFDSDSNCKKKKSTEEYLVIYKGKKKEQLLDLVKLFDKVMRQPNPDKKVLNQAMLKYNQTFCSTNPRSEISAHGQAADFIYSENIEYEMQQEFEMDEDDEEMNKLAKLLKNKKFDFDNDHHLEMLSTLLERMDKF